MRTRPDEPAVLGPREADALVRWSARLERVRTGAVLLAAALLLAVIAAVDASVDPMLALSAFYLLPVLVVGVRHTGAAALVACASAATWCAVDLLRDDAYASVAVPVANAFMRGLVFGVVVVLLQALRRRVADGVALAGLDPLTGLENTRSFYERVERARRELARTGCPLTLAYLDLDDFKLVNDRLGHAAGDEALRRAGRVLASVVREVDGAARLGGDEFGLLLTDADPATAERVLERVRRELGDLGASIGAVSFATPVAGVDEMVSRADAVMYQVKRAGKGAVRCVAA